MRDIAIYVEGGGDGPQTVDRFRKGMSMFLRPVADAVRARRIRWRVIPCGGRAQTYDAFVDALVYEPHVHNVLLVDSEDPVTITNSPWKHLLERPGDGWARPPRADNDHCQMMVACMEAWFLADPAGLRRHYGGKFDSRKLPAANLAESRTKQAISEALKKATRNTPAGEYQKIRDGAKLLERIDAAEVRKHCKWCQRLFAALGKAIGANV